MENVSTWRIRLEAILCKVMKEEDDGADRSKKLKTQWWTQLYDRSIKVASRHKFDDDSVTMNTLFSYVKKLEDELCGKSTGPNSL